MEDQKIYVLDTYGHNKDEDGLSTIYHRACKVGQIISSSKHLQNEIVCVIGMPFLYLDRIHNKNKNVVYTTFEHFPLPNHWVKAINQHYSKCIVPHTAIKEIFIQSGVQVPVSVVQQGFTRFSKVINSSDIQKNFAVGFLGVPVKRKNLQLLIKAVKKLVTDYIPQISLNIHVSLYYYGIKKSFIPFKKPWINYTEGYKSIQQVAEWFSKLSCYAFPSSGEGWSFTPRESLYLGIPTIITDIPVHKDLTQYCEMIPLRRGGKVGVKDITEAILSVYQNYVEQLEKAKAGSDWIKLQYKNEDVVKELQNELLL